MEEQLKTLCDWLRTAPALAGVKDVYKRQVYD